VSSNGEEHLDTALPELHRADAGVSDATPTAIGAESMVIFGTDHLDGNLPSERDGFEFVEGPCAGRGCGRVGPSCRRSSMVWIVPCAAWMYTATPSSTTAVTTSADS